MVVTEADLQQLVGQRVTIDQSFLDPPFITGILEYIDGLFAVDAEDDNGAAFFYPSDVASMHGTQITLETPLSLENEWEAYDSDTSEIGPPFAFTGDSSDDDW
jgi:hypothetical protein